MPYSFEEKYDEVVDTVSKYQAKWRLYALRWMDFEDISSEIVTHIWKKWHLWDQSRPLVPWVTQVCSNRIKNKLRDFYGRFARPCLKCEHNLEGTHCAITSNHEQCAECPLYFAWMQNKKDAYDVKIPLELENHSGEINNLPCREINYDLALDKFLPLLKEDLGEKLYRAFFMLYFEYSSDKEVAAFLEFKAEPFNSVAKQIAELKIHLNQRAQKVVQNLDLPELWH